MSFATVTALNTYPVKSCRGIALERAQITATGLPNDRRWLVMTEEGRLLTQRELPRLALVIPTFREGKLQLAAPGMVNLILPEQAKGSRVQVLMWGDQILKTYRWNAELHGVQFGQYAVIVSGIGAELRIGQRLTVVWK